MRVKDRGSQALKAALAQSYPVPSITYRAEIEWKDGLPRLVNAPVRLSESPENGMQALLRKVLDLPYDGSDPSLVGLSNGEAMIINMARDAASGDHDARTQVLDRLLGRPQQNIKSVTLSGDLNEFLDKVAAETQTQTVDITVQAEMSDVEDL